MAWRGEVRRGLVRYGRQGMFGNGEAGLGMVRRGKVWYGRQGLFGNGEAG